MPKSRSRRAYLDFASATPLGATALRAYQKALALFGNPSAAHAEGRAALAALALARTKIARSLAVKPDELVFTSGGTESNTLALLGVVRAAHKSGTAYKHMHIVSSTIEHSSISGALERLHEDKVAITYIPPEADGVVSAKKVIAALCPETLLITLAHVNSESGTIQPVADIGTALKRLKRSTILHVDAAQSPLWCDAGPHTLRAQVVSYDAQKVGGPKGVGVLYRNYSVPIAPITGGGTQERGMRPGTENVPAIVAAAVAFEEAGKGRKQRALKVAKLRDSLAAEIKKHIPNAVIIGSMKRRVANNLFIAIPGADGDYLTVLMDTKGVAVTPRSACLGSGGGVP